MSANCVLTFYSLPSTATEASFGDVWQKYVLGEVEGVACKNVYSFDMAPEALVGYLGQRKQVDEELLADIKAMLLSGASYMFVSPTVGGPIFGGYIAEYLA
jgi:hypothetical protein